MIKNIILKPKGPFSLKKLAGFTNDRIVGKSNIIIKKISSIESADTNSITFIDNKKYFKNLDSTKAGACIISDEGLSKYTSKGRLSFLVSKNPYLSYVKLLYIFYPDAINLNKNKINVSKSSQISKNADLKDNVSIGDNTIINSFTSIGPNVYIGKNCFIGNNVSISNTYIGNNVIIQDGTIIGQDGFGYVNNGKKYIKVPQIGIVKINDDVEIGSNCAIDRGSLNYTEIKKGVKIDNLVHIAHNVVIGENTVIAGQTGIAGSSSIGKNVLMGGQVGVSGHLSINDNVQIGAQSGVTKNISKNSIVSGTPSVNLKTYLKQAVMLKQMVEKK
ncbi:MAG: UDP-3-O-(3-hydroxymyristoyl)glucosamine N-acyltransferase [Alphaproteobacteria bacterium TMED194]|nr:MAG: UDP-3-O-(3-hydroxymyristoyl)glucosamine N-acyltransferase [Alphaproteobacteria bacterium TMED194]